MEIEEVVEIGKDFLMKAGYYNHKLHKIVLDESTEKWHLEYDVGVFSVEIIKITIDNETGRITTYERGTS